MAEKWLRKSLFFLWLGAILVLILLDVFARFGYTSSRNLDIAFAAFCLIIFGSEITILGYASRLFREASWQPGVPHGWWQIQSSRFILGAMVIAFPCGIWTNRSNLEALLPVMVGISVNLIFVYVIAVMLFRYKKPVQQPVR